MQWDGARALALAGARRYGPAGGASLIVNALMIALLVLSQPRFRLPPEAVFQVALIPAIDHRQRPDARVRPARPVPRTPVQGAPRVSVTPLTLPPQPPASRWTADLGAPAAERDVPSLRRSILERDACARGELWRLSTEKQGKCLERWGRFKPSEEARLKAPQLRDPHGSFARAAAAAEDQRHPFTEAPIGACPPGAPGSNFGVGCPTSAKGSLVKRIEGDRR
jgi:hypothetical protein